VSRSGPRVARRGMVCPPFDTGAPPKEDNFATCAAEVTELIIQHGIEEAKACGAEFHEPAPAGDPQRDSVPWFRNTVPKKISTRYMSRALRSGAMTLHLPACPVQSISQLTV